MSAGHFRTVPILPASNAPDVRRVRESMPGQEDWIRRARQGDREAFGKLALAHRDRVRGLLFRLLGADRLDDLEQDVFVQAWMGIGTFRGDAAFATWLTRIALNRAYRAMRRRRPPPAPLQETPDARPGPVAEAIGRERRARLAAAVATLPPKLRIAFTLRFVEGMKGVEIARALGVAEGTVRSRLHAALTTLRRRLRGDRP